MKVADLIDALTQYDPEADVAIVIKHNEAYFRFEVREQRGRSINNRFALVGLEVTERHLGVTNVIVDD